MNTLFSQVEQLMKQWRLEEATRMLEDARDRGERGARLFHELSVLYAQQGLLAQALSSLEEAMAMDPAHLAQWQHLLALHKNDSDVFTAQRWRGMHLAYGDLMRRRFDATHLGVPRDRGVDRTLRVGYLAPDTHRATERFIAPLFQHCDRKRHEIFAYWVHTDVHSRARQFPGSTHRSFAGAPIEAMARQVLDDRIDVLVDVAGHGAGSLVPLLALRTAPVQLTWLDYLATTGLQTVDARITDAIADPEGAEAAHVERLARLPVAQWCFQRPTPTAMPRPPANGDVVLGSVCVPLKISDDAIRAWASILRTIPRARLRCLGIPEGRARDRILSVSASHGVGHERIEFLGRLGLDEFQQALLGIDVVLDSFPFSGATSTFDALAAGKPVVTIAGRHSHSRSTASILTHLGHPEWVANDVQSYRDIAVALAHDTGRRSSLATTLGAKLAASTLCDGAGFMRAMEATYRAAWSRWARATTSFQRTNSPNERMDVLLTQGRPGAGRHLSRRCEELIDVLPAHPATAQAFWSEVLPRLGSSAASDGDIELRQVADLVDLADNTADDGSSTWVLLWRSDQSDPDSLPKVVPSSLLGSHDLLASVGADRLFGGDIALAGPGHVRGIHAFADGDRVLVNCWLPREVGGCVVLWGAALLIRRALLEKATVEAMRPSIASFQQGIMIASAHAARSGTRLGVTSRLALLERLVPADAAETAAKARDLEAQLNLDPWDRPDPAASPVRGAIPRDRWPNLRAALSPIVGDD